MHQSRSRKGAWIEIAAQSFMNDLIDDQMKSGSGNVTGQPANGLTEAEEDALRTEKMAKTLQNMYGGNK